MNSKIFTGTVRHQRFLLKPHNFQYRLFMLYIDLSELDRIFNPYWFWSAKQPNIAYFKRSKYLGDPETPLLNSVQALIKKTTQSDIHHVHLLTHLAYCGYCFNPISLYFCFDKDHNLTHCLAEVTNTPWGEQTVYALPLETIKPNIYTAEFKKQLHVSPFLTMDYTYKLRCKHTHSHIIVHIENWQNQERHFDATLSLQAQPITSVNLAKTLLQFPLMTTQVITAIHWQALKLFLKGIPVIFKRQ